MKTLSVCMILISFSFASFSGELPFKNTSPSESSKAEKLNQALQAANLPAQAIHYVWDPGNTAWVFDYKSLYTYNPNGLLIQEVEQDENNQDLRRSALTYDSEGRIISELNEIYNGSQWQNQGKYTMEYDSHGHRTFFTVLEWASNTWDTVYAQQDDLVHNADDFVTEVTIRTRNSITTMWGDSYKQEFELDTNGWPTRMTYTVWSGSSELIYNYTLNWRDWNSETLYGSPLDYLYQEWNGQAWDDKERGTYQYDSYGGFVNIVEQYNSGTWTNYKRNTHVYNDHYRPVERKYDVWNMNMWVIDHHYTQYPAYDVNDNITEVIHKLWNPSSGQLENDRRDVYSDFTAGLTSVQNNDLKIFPNPAKDRLTLDLTSKSEKLFIYNQLGQEVRSLDVTDEKMQIDVSGLTPGMYLIKATGAEGTFTGKFIKE